MKKLLIQKRTPEEIILKNKNQILNFVNLNTFWWVKNSDFYFNIVSSNENKNFIDGKILSFFSGIGQYRGPTFTKEFLISPEARKKKHFFIGLEDSDKKELSQITKMPLRNIYSYNPPYINDLEFSPSERQKISKLLKKSKADFVWVCVGSPKQEILANQLFSLHKSTYVNVGAALDFILGKKREAPKFFQKTGLEWFYRLTTDFKYSRKKVWRSFVGLGYLLFGKVKIEVRK